MEFNELYFYTSTINKWKTILRDFNLEPHILSSLSYLHSKSCIRVFGFVIMPSHIQMIWELLCNNGKESPAASLMKFTAHVFEKELRLRSPELLNQFSVDWTCRKFNIWQPDPHWFLLYRERMIRQKLNYIHLNPMRKKWRLVEDPAAYYYSSARFYKTGISEFDFLYDYRDRKQ